MAPIVGHKCSEMAGPPLNLYVPFWKWFDFLVCHSLVILLVRTAALVYFSPSNTSYFRSISSFTVRLLKLSIRIVPELLNLLDLSCDFPSNRFGCRLCLDISLFLKSTLNFSWHIMCFDCYWYWTKCADVRVCVFRVSPGTHASLLNNVMRETKTTTLFTGRRVFPSWVCVRLFRLNFISTFKEWAFI